MLGRCSRHHRFPVCSSGGNSNRKPSFWRLVGICVFPCRTGTLRTFSPSEACTPITSQCGVRSSGMPQNWNDVCARSSNRQRQLAGRRDLHPGQGQVAISLSCGGFFRRDPRLSPLGQAGRGRSKALPGQSVGTAEPSLAARHQHRRSQRVPACDRAAQS